ncbi:MAG: hypothetical protein AB1393_01890 [Candidatus Edwardsbacteria bacterium]
MEKVKVIIRLIAGRLIPLAILCGRKSMMGQTMERVEMTGPFLLTKLQTGGISWLALLLFLG